MLWHSSRAHLARVHDVQGIDRALYRPHQLDGVRPQLLCEVLSLADADAVFPSACGRVVNGGSLTTS